MMPKENNENARELAMLRYQVEHYQSQGKGAITQQLNAEIRRLVNKMDAVKE